MKPELELAEHPSAWSELVPRLAAKAIIATALVVIAPFIIWTNVGGHDSEVHFQMWTEAARQWHEGILYPSWAALANYGYGEPRFLFYPPLSWMLGAAFLFVLPSKMVPGAYVFITLLVAGACMFRFAREWLPPRDAVLATVLYMANPYNLLIVFWRGDYAELLAWAFLPLVILGAVRAGRGRMADLGQFGFLFALTWLANLPAAVITSYSVAMVILVMAVCEREWRPVIRRAAGLLFGFALAAFFIVPAGYEKQWINISEALAPWLTPDQNLLFTTIADPTHTVFNLFMSAIASVQISVLATAFVFSDRLRAGAKRVWAALLFTAAAAALLMFSVSKPLWRIFPELRYVQFPWRFLIVINFALAFLVPALRVPPWSKWAAGLAISVALLVFSSPLLHVWNGSEVLARVQSSLTEGIGYEGLREYAPKGSDISKLQPSAPFVAVTREANRQVPGKVATMGSLAGTANIRVLRWDTKAKLLEVDSPGPSDLAMRLLAYPAWKIQINGDLATARSGGAGEVLIHVPPGHSEVRVTFSQTDDRVIGWLLSGIAVFVFMVLCARELRTTEVA
jgi:hypothetical protein